MVYQVVRPTLGEMLKVFKCKACIVSTPEKMPAPGSNDPPYDVVPTMKILEHLCDTAKCLLPAYDFAGSASKKDCSDKLPDCNMSAGDWTCPASIAQSQWARYWMGRVRATLTTLAFTTQPAEVKVTAFAGYDSSNAYSVQAGNIIIFAISLGPGGPITQTEFSLLPSLFSGTIADISTRNVRLNPVQIWWLHFEHVRDMVRAFQGYGYLDVHRYVQFDRPRGKPLRWNDTDANQPSHDLLTPSRQSPDGYWSYLMSGADAVPLNERLFKAIGSGHKERVSELLSEGADPNAIQETGLINKDSALQYALLCWNVEIVQTLLEAGADAHYRNAGGCTAKHYLDMCRDQVPNDDASLIQVFVTLDSLLA
eukprot:TRINITY_DN20091_c1_g1_i2.p1 TRINITY_DN20091_c1_g1~~TRINITY_DN20091_c1_g1_i2.p1  ORF type:complete len:367 (+),score=37.58 TRINITY_DN20091_c1_g1_i2:84-1184(+)